MELNTKMLERIKKLLALARDKGATEAEAALAADKATELMAEYGISIAEAELKGEQGEARVREARDAGGRKWTAGLVKAIAEVCSVTAIFQHAGPNTISKYELVGRTSAVQTAKMLIEYLAQTIYRLEREYTGTGERRYFGRGCAEKLAERLRERHELQEQRQRAEEENKWRREAGTTNALVPVLEDWEQKERDLNNDLINGDAPGTTSANRQKYEVERAAAAAVYQKRHDLWKQKSQELMAANPLLNEEEAWYMVQGFDPEREQRRSGTW